ncbi:ATPase family AAA domain-containing protein 1-A [Cercophora scortea]|uniref:ATPase family AAA domain-containing protein 1-A n=1 Tax=Cercophora scortea TaxID=314031 RepID=A0AAE0IDL5_9PEZI|nr:ATPase family AAA domain-containing protein 1-A [Cercophora scortea]
MTETDPTTSQDSLDVIDSAKETNEEEPAEEVQKPGEYLQPAWFLARNVKILSQLDNLPLPSKIVFTTKDDDETTDSDSIEITPPDNVSDKAYGSGNDESTNAASGEYTPITADCSSEDGKEDRLELEIDSNSKETDTAVEKTLDIIDQYKISQDVFSELRDVTAAAFVPDRKGQLSKSHPSVLIRSSKDSQSFVEGVLVHLAKYLQANLLSFGLEDLEELGWDFNRQDQEGPKAAETHEELEDPDRYIHGEMAKHYFGSPSYRNAYYKTWERSQKAIDTILDSVNAETKTAAAGSPPLILHLRDCAGMISLSYGRRLLGRFRDVVQRRRGDGQAAVLVVSVFKTNCSNCTHSEEWHYQNTAQKKMRVASKFIVTMDPTVPDGITNAAPPRRSVSADNLREMRRLLQWRARHLFLPGVLDSLVYEDESTKKASEFGRRYKAVNEHEWTKDKMEHILTQITGRSYGRTHVDLDDVGIVLVRFGLCKRVKGSAKESGGEGEGAEMDASDGEKSEEPGHKTETLAEKNTRVRASLTSGGWEEMAAEGIVNPEDLEYTYDDVIIDQETKEAVIHMAAMFNFKPAAASAFLLKHIQLTGALFYGPPGTGKTHLARAIAKASGSSMLAIDGASIQNKYVGETEKAIQAAFTLAEKLHPCVLFIDEVDSLFYRRASNDASWQRSALSQFLTQMDGLSKSPKAPFVLVATNHPQDLDEAFFRRLPRKIFFKLPDLDSREKILRLFLKDEDLDPSVDVKDLARRTEGYSGSDLKSLCAEAAMAFALEQMKAPDEGGLTKLVLTDAHVRKALGRIRPSVSEKVMEDLMGFARRFNPEAVESLSGHAYGPARPRPGTAAPNIAKWIASRYGVEKGGPL